MKYLFIGSPMNQGINKSQWIEVILASAVLAICAAFMVGGVLVFFAVPEVIIQVITVISVLIMFITLLIATSLSKFTQHTAISPENS